MFLEVIHKRVANVDYSRGIPWEGIRTAWSLHILLARCMKEPMHRVQTTPPGMRRSAA